MHSLWGDAMKKLALVLLFALVAFPGLLSATAYSCAGTGTRNWHIAASWTPNGIPGAGDTVSIPAGCTMQCEALNSCIAGKAGAPGTTDLTIQVGGNLTLLNGSSLDMRGSVLLSGELDIFGGAFILDPAVASGSANYAIDGGSAAGADTLKVCSESTCSSSSGLLGILTCKTGASGSCQITHTSGSGNGMNVLGSHGQISNFGTANTLGISLNDGTQPPTGGFVLKNGFSLHHNGDIRIGYNSPALNLTFAGVSFDGLVDKTQGGNGPSFLELYSLSAPTSGDRTFQVTCANTGARNAVIYLYVVNPNMGDSTHPGMIGYNCTLLKGLTGGTFQNVLSVIDRNYQPGASAIASAYNADASFQNWVLLNHTPNQHHIVSLSINGGSSGNAYSQMTFDGDGYVATDAGDDYQDFGTYSASNGLHINASGTTYTLGASTAQAISLDHETAYDTFGGAMCEGQCVPTMFVKWSNSIFVKPSELSGAEFLGNDGMHADANYSYANRQTASSVATDFNVFWQMPGSGDPGAYPAKNTYIQLNLGSTPSWVAMVPPGSSISRNQSVNISGGVNVSCSGCFTNAQAKDYIVDTTRVPNTYAVIESVSDPSHAVLYAPIPNYQAGDLADIRPGYFASNGLYGVDWGSHDQHMNPQFADPTRTVCTWWKAQSGSPANCNWPSANNFTATKGTDSTTIVDSSVNFMSMGVVDRVDQVLVYSSDWGTMRGSSLVIGHGPNSLRLAGFIPGTTSGDHFTFVTAAENLGLSAVQLYGFDANGNGVKPPAWVNLNMVQNLQSYLRQGFMPKNFALFGAGSDGKTVGAVDATPTTEDVSAAPN